MINSASTNERPLRPGDVVEVRSLAEILATLDADAALDKMPFMPEMARYAGRRYTVSRRVDKICDTIGSTGSRRMYTTVYLEDLRCDGSSHGGCQAGCKIYWKEAWLRRVGDEATSACASDDDAAKLMQLAQAGTRTIRALDGAQCEVWRCQATQAFDASDRLRGFDPRPHWRELTNGNFSLLGFAHILTRIVLMRIGSYMGLVKALPLRGPGYTTSLQSPLNLQPGDLVEVRSQTEVESTLDEAGFTRGLSFDREMLPYCGRTFHVKDRVQKIVDDKTGRLLNIRKDCVILDGATCSGERTLGCWFCPREIYPFWREAWLRRADEQKCHTAPNL